MTDYQCSAGGAMIEWAKWLLTMIATVAVVWSGMQTQLATQEYRLAKIETTLDGHLGKHDIQYENIISRLSQMQLDMARNGQLSADHDGR